MGRLYSAALRDGHALEAVYPDGSRRTVPVPDWCGPLLPGDASLLGRCTGTTLDVGCGAGRLTAALQRRGVHALGIDVNRVAVRLARRAGAPVRLCSLWGEVPRAGSWDVVLLADGNIGIGGAPVAVLRRARALLAPGGRVLAEVDGSGGPSRSTRLRLVTGDRISRPFPWAHLALTDAPSAAARAGLCLDESWRAAGRCFVAFGR